MEGRSLWRRANPQYLTGFPAISDILSSFARQICFLPSCSLVTSPQRLSNGDTNATDIIEISNGSLIDSVFGDVPSTNEVEHAVAALQSFMQRLSPSAFSRNDQRRRLKSPVLQRVDDAFCLLQTVPSVLIMVVSITSDIAVWDAVMKNNEVQDFQRSIAAILWKPRRSDETDKDSNLVSIILWWMIDNSTLTIIGLIEKLKALVSKSFQPSQEEKAVKPDLEELITSAVLLSTLTLMIVIAIRTYGI